jgi:hypothetical protein
VEIKKIAITMMMTSAMEVGLNFQQKMARLLTTKNGRDMETLVIKESIVVMSMVKLEMMI